MHWLRDDLRNHALWLLWHDMHYWWLLRYTVHYRLLQLHVHLLLHMMLWDRLW
jgi:hypothetical protein